MTEEHLAQGINSPFTRILKGMKNLRSSLRANWNENGIFISVSGNPWEQMAVRWCCHHHVHGSGPIIFIRPQNSMRSALIRQSWTLAGTRETRDESQWSSKINQIRGGQMLMAKITSLCIFTIAASLTMLTTYYVDLDCGCMRRRSKQGE